MKRILIAFVVVSLLFCGCSLFAPGPQEQTQAPTEAPATSATEPAIEETERQKRIKGWNKAVKYAYGWAKEE